MLYIYWFFFYTKVTYLKVIENMKNKEGIFFGGGRMFLMFNSKMDVPNIHDNNINHKDRIYPSNFEKKYVIKKSNKSSI